MADKEDLLRIKRRLQKDKRAQRLKDSFDRLSQYNLPLRELYDEVERIHMARKTRHLDKRSDTFVQDVTEALIGDQSDRGRLSEILMACVNVIRELEDALENLEGYMLIEYATEMSAIRTKSERSTFIRQHVLNTFHKYVQRVSRVKGAVEIVIVDIDKAGFMYKNLIEVVKLAAGRREVM